MIKYPGGEIAFWSILFIVAGAFVSYTTFAAGKIGLGFVFAMMPVGCVARTSRSAASALPMTWPARRSFSRHQMPATSPDTC